ncbi:MAG: potassium/proton antiporter [Anaerolineae bacterium]|nr:potassium/proton antiporter [Anaerolineae bacterium]
MIGSTPVSQTPLEYLLLGAAVLLLVSILASKASGRLGVPALALFLVIGMLAGSDGPGGIYFDDPRLAQWLGVIALVFILYAGGLDTDWARIRPVLAHGLALSTVGVLLTAALMGLFAVVALRFTLLQGLLLGAIVSSTDAAAVFTVLRARSVRLREPLEPLLELESGSNDPMAVFLTVALTGLLTTPEANLLRLVPAFFQQMLLGALFGYGMGQAMAWIVNHVRLHVEGLYPVLTVALTLLTYAGTAMLGGNGFLAVYLAGLIMARGDFIHKRSLLRFHDGLAWLMQIAMFLALGLLVFPSRLPAVAGVALLAALFLIFIARPIGIVLTLLPFRLPARDQTMIAWVGLRGAVPIILATFPQLAGLPQADLVFDIVFFVVLTSVLIQGTTISVVARWLKVTAVRTAPPRPPLGVTRDDWLKGDLLEMVVPAGSAAVGRQVLELGLPRGALIVLIGRGSEHIVPDGNTLLEPGDHLLILADRAVLPAARQVFVKKPPAA